jgi:hypothetical protein
MTIEFTDKEEGKVVPYTFEDALSLSNIELLRGLDRATGLTKKMKSACDQSTLSAASQMMYDSLDSKGKAQMALDIIFDINPKDLAVPSYIAEGLEWLQTELCRASQDYTLESLEDEAVTNGQ